MCRGFSLALHALSHENLKNILRLPLPPLTQLKQSMYPSLLSHFIHAIINPNFLSALLRKEVIFYDHIYAPYQAATIKLRRGREIRISLTCEDQTTNEDMPLILYELKGRLFPRELLCTFLYEVYNLSKFRLSTFSNQLCPPLRSDLRTITFPFTQSRQGENRTALYPNTLPFQSFFARGLPTSRTDRIRHALFQYQHIKLRKPFFYQIATRPQTTSLTVTIRLCP